MGLARGAIALLLDEAVRRPFSGRIATLGKQTIYASNREIRQQFDKFGVRPAVPIDWGGAGLDDVQVLRALGFDTVHSYDYSDFEGADRVIDLNLRGVPDDAAGSYDVVLDSGTLEHVFHLPNALANVADMVKVGGRVILLSPSSNHIDHGFYMFSPTLFSDYFRANRFTVERIYVVRYSGSLDELWEAYAYDAKGWRDLHIGGLDGNPYVLFVVATRTEHSTSEVIPQQGYYAADSAAYAGSHLATEGAAGSPPPLGAMDDPAAPTALAATAPMVARKSAASGRLRAVARRVPGARRLVNWLRRQAMVATPGAAAPTQALNKPLVGRF